MTRLGTPLMTSSVNDTHIGTSAPLDSIYHSQRSSSKEELEKINYHWLNMQWTHSLPPSLTGRLSKHTHKCTHNVIYTEVYVKYTHYWYIELTHDYEIDVHWLTFKCPSMSIASCQNGDQVLGIYSEFQTAIQVNWLCTRCHKLCYPLKVCIVSFQVNTVVQSHAQTAHMYIKVLSFWVTFVVWHAGR